MPNTYSHRSTGSITAAGLVLASCPACGIAASFWVPLAMVPNRHQQLMIQRRCDSNWCNVHRPWYVELAAEEPSRTDAPVTAPPERLISDAQAEELLRQTTATAERQAEPAPAPATPAEPEDRHTLSQWAQAARGLGPARRSVIATVLAVPPVTVARHFRRLYGLEPRWDRSCSYRTYSWSELAAIATELEAAA
jgi:hypothetical protein